MWDKDSKTIFEAYQAILETPIDPGDAWDMPSTDIANKLKDLKSKRQDSTLDELLTQYNVIDPENKIKIIDFTRRYLESMEMHFSGSKKEFSSQLADQLKDKANDYSFPKFRAPHISRVLVNALVELNVMSTKGEIKDTSKLDNPEEVLDTLVDEIPDEVPTQGPTADKFDKNVIYNVDVLAADTLPEEHRDVAEYAVENEGATGHEILDHLKTKIMFNEPSTKGGFDGNEGKLLKVLTDLVVAGVLIPAPKSDEDTELEDPNLNDPEDVEQADRDFIDRAVQQAEWGSAKPTFGLEDY